MARRAKQSTASADASDPPAPENKKGKKKATATTLVKSEPVEPTLASAKKKNSKIKNKTKAVPTAEPKLPPPAVTKGSKKKKTAVDKSTSDETTSNAHNADSGDNAPLKAPKKKPSKAKQLDGDAKTPTAPSSASAKTSKKTKKKTQADVGTPSHAAPEPTKAPTKKKKKPVQTPETDLPEAAAPTNKTLKRKRDAVEALSEATTSQPKKKKKTTAKPTPEVPSAPKTRPKQKKSVKFGLPSDEPPSSSQTLAPSSPPPSDAPTIVEDEQHSSPPNKTPKKKTKTADSTVTDPLKTSKTKKSKGKSKKKSKAADSKPAADPVPEPDLICDRGIKEAGTGFTCALCSPPELPADSECQENEPQPDPSDGPVPDFNWPFSFGYAFQGAQTPLESWDRNMCVDVTPLSAIPFLEDPVGFYAPASASTGVGGVSTPTDGDDEDRWCITVDGLRVQMCDDPPKVAPADGYPDGYDEEGCVTIDGVRFTYDGMCVDPPAGGVFCGVPTTDERERVRMEELVFEEEKLESGPWWTGEPQVKEEEMVESEGEEEEEEEEEFCYPTLRLPDDMYCWCVLFHRPDEADCF